MSFPPSLARRALVFVASAAVIVPTALRAQAHTVAHATTAHELTAAPVAPVAPAEHAAKPKPKSKGAAATAAHAPAAADAHGAHAASPAAATMADFSSCREPDAPTAVNRPVLPSTAGPEYAAFIDPTAHIEAPERVRIGCHSYIAPFAALDATLGPISIGVESNVQDNVTIAGKLVVLGDRVIVAHGATVVGPATIGESGGKPAFVGFNAYIDGATVEEDAMVNGLARVAPGVVIHSGRKVLPGKFIRTQAEADDESLGKVVAVTDADRDFMRAVLHVNTDLARHYAELQHLTPALLSGIGRNPGESDFNLVSDLPMLAGHARAVPLFRNRIIGHVELADSAEQLAAVMGRSIAIRADEGNPFVIGHLGKMQDRVTIHALEHTEMQIGDGGWFGYHAVIHGGTDAVNAHPERTQIGNGVAVKDWAVVFRSTIGDGSIIGVRAYVDGCSLPPKSVVPDRAIMIHNKIVGTVEW